MAFGRQNNNIFLKNIWPILAKKDFEKFRASGKKKQAKAGQSRPSRGLGAILDLLVPFLTPLGLSVDPNVCILVFFGGPKPLRTL